MPNKEVDNLEDPRLKAIQNEFGQDGKADDEAKAEAEAKAKEDAEAADALEAKKALETDATNKGDEGEEFDAQKSIQKLEDELSQSNKNYDELRRKATQDWQSAAEQKRQYEQMQKSMESMVDKLNSLNREKVDPEQFMEDLKSQGPKALDNYIKSYVDPLKEKNEKATEARKKADNIRNYEIQFLRRSVNTEKYPGFANMEDKMNELAAKPDCPVNLQGDIGEVLDALYKLSKDSSSDNAVKKALDKGAEQERKRLAKEAKTGVAGSGRSRSSSEVPDLYNMPLEKLRAMLPKNENRDYD